MFSCFSTDSRNVNHQSERQLDLKLQRSDQELLGTQAKVDRSPFSELPNEMMLDVDVFCPLVGTRVERESENPLC
jgi:hypothetical protein